MSTLEKLRDRASTVVGLTGTASHQWRSRLINAGPVVALVVLIIVFAITSSVFLTGSNLATIGSQLSILLVLAVGMTFVILLGSIDLSSAVSYTHLRAHETVLDL